jgi:predicted transcriptional regulator
MTETLSEKWQLGEIRAGIADIDEGHERVAKLLASWGNPGETNLHDESDLVLV